MQVKQTREASQYKPEARASEFVFRANGPAIFLAQPNGLGLIALHTLGLKARPLHRTIVVLISNVRAFGPTFITPLPSQPFGLGQENCQGFAPS